MEALAVLCVLIAVIIFIAARKRADRYLIAPYLPGDSEYRGNYYALSETR